jgi:hypothetical protein
MDSDERLLKLKTLKIERREGPLFKTANDCMFWIDNVAPLLKYDEDHYNTFLAHAQYVRITTLSADAIMAHLNSMIGIVDQAIIELENNIESPHKAENGKLEYPEKMTLKWIWEHVPANYYWYFLLILFFVFSLGVAFSKTNLYKSLTDLTTAITKTSKPIEKTKQ